MSTIVNLDRIAAQYAQKIVNEDVKVKDLENQVTKSLGVLQEQGIYALMLLLFSQDSKETKAFMDQLQNFEKIWAEKHRGGSVAAKKREKSVQLPESSQVLQ